MDCLGLPIPVVCCQCGTDQNPCHCKILGPTIGFCVAVAAAVVCWPAAILCGCCATGAGKRMLGAPADISASVTHAIPI